MTILIFSECISDEGMQEELQRDVQKVLTEHPSAKIEWHQTSAMAGGGMAGYSAFTRLTAVVTFP